jgi:hypothetical protein
MKAKSATISAAAAISGCDSRGFGRGGNAVAQVVQPTATLLITRNPIRIFIGKL